MLDACAHRRHLGCRGSQDFLEELIPALQEKYTVSIEIMSGPGDVPEEDTSTLGHGRMVIRIHPKHLDQLCKLLHLSKKLQNKKSPGHSEIETPDKSEELPQHEASVYRSCIGILLYLSSDLPQCQYVIRYLSTCASKHAEGNDDSEAFGWLHARPSRRVRFSEVERNSSWLAQRLRVRRASTGDFQ